MERGGEKWREEEREHCITMRTLDYHQFFMALFRATNYSKKLFFHSFSTVHNNYLQTNENKILKNLNTCTVPTENH